MNRIANELVRSRLRFRALLQLLLSKGLIEMHEYVAEYQRQEELSFVPLADMLFFDAERFFRQHHEWVENEHGGLFAVLRSEKPSPEIVLIPNMEAETNPESPSEDAP